eukprot:UN03371
MHSVNLYSKTNYAVQPTLILECHLASQQEIPPTEAYIQKLGAEHKLTSYIATSSEAEYEELWQARKDALFAAYKLYRCPPQCGNTGKKTRVAVFVTDVCVPLPKLPAIISETEQDFNKEGFPCPIAAHIADGNYHCFIPHDTNDPKQVEIVTRLNSKLIKASNYGLGSQ